MDIKGLMQKKIAGIPAIYVAGLFVAILAFVAWRMKPAKEPPVDNTTPDDTSGDPAGDSVPTFVANPAPTYSTGVPANGAPVSIDDNDKWTRRAIEWLIGQGIATPSVATNAIQKYIAGEQLSQSEGALRDAAIRQFGLPPELPTGGGTDIPAPTPTPAPGPDDGHIPPKFHTVKGSSDNTWTEIAQLYYHRSDDAAIDLLQSYNVRLKSPFAAGTKLWVPRWTSPKYVKATATMRTTTQLISKNPPLNSVAMLQTLNDGMHFPVKVGTRVRVA